MKDQPYVSVIVPVYNAQDTIQECIDSLLKLDYPKERMELIFVDNDSTDGTQKILESYERQIRTFCEKERGPAAARNKGILNAGGEVVACTDADCVVDREWLQWIVQPLHDQDIGIVGGTILSKRPCNRIEKFGELIHDHYRAMYEFKPAYVITMNWASRLSVLKKVELFDTTFIRCEDVDLSFRISQAGFRFEYVPEAVVHHANERTLFGLFREGYLHGFYAIRTAQVHDEYMRKNGYRRFDSNSYRHLLNSLIDYSRNRNRPDSLYHVVFNTGKKLGKCLGSMRFGYLDI